ncbi:Flap endonuclease GEN-like protein [Lachnellula occidentalis]|uniref:Flap endonuclease GEN-like protein n=1 Tax=Lachnellula occidentalis TaxID=215460 RepID=A0A8H8RNU8_9HELO|nr:Flap endonuclease GEN-like protein [Lachnellula occidentalis]
MQYLLRWQLSALLWASRAILYRLWDKLGQGEVIEIAAYAARHFEQHKRPLRIAVDEAIWRYNFYLPPSTVARICLKCPEANPNEKNILWRVLQLLRLNIRLVFVTDGPRRPKKRNLDIHYGNNDNETGLLREMLQQLGVPWHRAPAEAEAECAMLQKLGIVDAVWTEDSDALMFGATTVIRFCHKPAGGKPTKNNLKVRVYHSEEITKTYPCLDREGMVLFAVLSGGDYNTVGLPNVGPEGALEAAKQGLSHTLCRASENGTLQAWKEELQMHLVNTGSKVRVPAVFPDPGHVKCYNKPLVSFTRILRNLEPQWWNMTFGDALWDLLLYRFNLWLPDFIQLVAPIFLVRSLAQTSPGQEASNSCYQILHVKHNDKMQSEVSFILSAVMTWDLSKMVAEFTRDRRQQPPERVVVKEILDCILQHGIPDVMKGVERQPIPGKKKGKASKDHTDDTTAIPHEPLKTGNKRERKSKTTVQDSAVNENEQVKRRKLSTSDTRSIICQDPPAPATKEKPVTQKSKVIDLTSDSEEDNVLAPLSPLSQARQARLRHFEPKVLKVNGGTSENQATNHATVTGTENMQGLIEEFRVPGIKF